MTAIGAGDSRILVGDLVLLDKSKLKITKVPQAITDQLEQVWKDQFKIFTSKPDNHPDNTYATVKVNGKVVATLYNSGVAEMTNAVGAQASSLPSMSERETLTGPMLAEKRAREIARAAGGTVEKASTAQTAAEWRPTKVTWTYDYAGMAAAQKERDAALAASRQSSEAFRASLQTQIDAQMIGQDAQ